MAAAGPIAVEDSDSLGARLRSLRLRRGLTQEGLAITAGVGVDVVKRLERGVKSWARLATLRALSDALDVPLSELTGREPRVGQPGERLVLDLRDALFGTVPGLPSRVETEPTSLAGIHRDVDAAWGLYAAGQFERLAARLPGVLTDVRLLQQRSPAGESGEEAVLTSQALQVTAQLLVQLGREDLAAAAAEHAVSAALRGPDRLQWANAAAAYAWVHHAGFARPATAVPLALGIADEIRPGGDAPVEDVIVWGAVLITALAAAGAADDADTVDDILPEAQEAARRVGTDTRHHHVLYGPAALGMQVVYSALSLGRPDQALDAARGLDVDRLRPVSHARHLLDIAQALTDLGRDDEAVQVLARAENLAPVWFRHVPLVRSLLDEIGGRQARMTTTLRRLAQAASQHT
jgi:transcriptional regulator with XRE-family HTH domain